MIASASIADRLPVNGWLRLTFRPPVSRRSSNGEFSSRTVDAAEYYGTLAALVRQHGRNPRPRRMDLQIAATAACHGLTLLTRNGNDFTGLETALNVVDLTDR